MMKKRKMNLILVIISIMVTMCFSCLNGCNKNNKGYEILAKNECHKAFVLSDVYYENCANSKTAFDTVMINFSESDGEYTDNFGGCFIDCNGIYNVCVVGSHELVNSDYLIFKEVDHSFKLLNDIYKDLIKHIDKYNIWSVGICEVCNKIKICTESENQIDLIVKQLKADGLFKKNTLLFYVSKNLNSPNGNAS